MAEAQLQQFLEKVRQLNAFVALTEQNPALREALRRCDHHHEVIALATGLGFDIGRRWGDPAPASQGTEAGTAAAAAAAADQINLLSSPCPPSGEETVVVLERGHGWRLERIHSCQASSGEGFWYDQADWEWVLVLRGSARLQFEDESQPRDLCVGDSLMIRPHRRHRLVATDPAPGTLWLALFATAEH